jgi:myosin-1
MFVFVEQVELYFISENINVQKYFQGFCHRAPYDRFVQRYKIIDSVRSKLYPRGPLTKESAGYICREINLDNDVAYGNTKLFIKQP